jgi:pyruvate,water dikinase
LTLCVPLSEAPARAVAGGKGACLGELIRAGMPVPGGFVVTTDAFAGAMRAIDPGGQLRAAIEARDTADLPGLARAAARARDAIITTPLPAWTAAAIANAYAGLPGEDVAVRSSATMEDSADASFAGLQDTYLGIRGESGVLDAVRRCWASLYNDESVAYRRRLGLPEQPQSMAVVVQLMVAPQAAGVLFTRSPVTGDRSVVAIEGTPGLGAALVAGEVTPDSFMISKITGEITSRRVQAAQPCLTDGELRALAAVARKVEAHYGVPQDIEWAVLAGDGSEETRIVLLQSRPETVWAARDAAPQAPVATPRPRAADHVLSLFAKGLR